MRTGRFLLAGGCAVVMLSGCPVTPAPQPGVNGTDILVSASVLTIPTNGIGTFTVALAQPPPEPVVLEVTCIAGGCGFAVQNSPELVFDSSTYANPQLVVLGDIGFKGRGQSIFQISGGPLEPSFVLVIRD